MNTQSKRFTPYCTVSHFVLRVWRLSAWRSALLLVVFLSCAASQNNFAQTPTAAARAALTPKQQAFIRFMEARQLRAQIEQRQNQKLLDEAITAYQAAIALDPQAAEPHVDLGELYFFFRNDVVNAERAAQTAIRLDNQSVGAHLLLARLSIVLFKLGASNDDKTKRTAQQERDIAAQFNRAISEYETVAKLNPNSAEAWALLADLYRAKQDLPRYTQALERWASAPLPSDPFFYRWLASADLTPDQAFAQLSQVYLGTGKSREALDAARRAYELNPAEDNYANNLMGVIAATKTLTDAAKLYARLRLSAPSPTLDIGYGATLVRLGRNAEAVDILRAPAKAFGTEGNQNLLAVTLLATAQRRSGQTSAALETLKAALKRANPTQTRTLTFELAELYEISGNTAQAIAQYEQMVEGYGQKGTVPEESLRPFGRALTQLARLLRQQGEQTKLQTLLTRARRWLDEQNPLIDTIAIDGLRAEGKPSEALDRLRGVARRVPEDKNLRLTEVLLLSDLRRFKEAEEILLHLLDGRQEAAAADATVQLVLSSVQERAGLLKEAEAAARKALALQSNSNDARMQLSSLLDRTGRATEAEELLRAVIANEPDNATALNNLGYQLVERDAKLPEAQQLIERALAIEPQNGSFLDSLGWAHYKQGNYEQARQTLERALLHAPNNATIHEHLGDVLNKLGLRTEAQRNWEKALKLAQSEQQTARLKNKLKPIQ